MSVYISLKEATKYCNYSQDYLKLRARQGKLKAVKIGRNWATTREWVEEYASCGRPVSAAKNDQFSICPLFTHSNSQFSSILMKLMVILVTILIIVGIFINFDIFSEYLQWQTANLGEVFEKGLGVIPERIIEIK